jgi:hypothetical protein
METVKTINAGIHQIPAALANPPNLNSNPVTSRKEFNKRGKVW